MAQPVLLYRESFPDRPAFDTAVSRALLLRTAAGELGESVRVHRPGAMVAFGRQDVRTDGYQAAVAAARKIGFEAVERLPGGRAAVLHEHTLSYVHTIPNPDFLSDIHVRFRREAEMLTAALRRTGVDARVGEIPQEYCPGEWSINAGGKTKIAGVAQRLIAKAVHVGAVVVAAEAGRIRDALVPVYEALGLGWDPATVGSVTDEVPAGSFETVEAALLAELDSRYDLVETLLSEEILAAASELEHEHRAPR